jgi:predicted DNA-binding transcriptional regulator YafY
MAQPSALGDPRLAAAAERAFGKLMAALPGRMREQAESMRARLHVDATGWRPAQEDLSMLPVVQDAIARDVKLSFEYRRADGQVGPRTVDPMGMVCKQNVWYLVARAPAGMRSYRVSRMTRVVALAMRFKRPAKFSLAAYWKQSTVALEEKRERYGATLALAAEAQATLRGWCAMTPHVGTAEVAEGWGVFRVEFESRAQAQFIALGYGMKARVIVPEELRMAVKAEAGLVASRSV